jgi:hypothetical protein
MKSKRLATPEARGSRFAPSFATTLLGVLGSLSAPQVALAQAPAPAPAATAAPPAPGGAAPGAPAPAPVAPPVVITAPYGVPVGTSVQNLNTYLPSSSQPSMDTSKSSDYFDFAPGKGQSPVVRGDANSGYVPPGHVETQEPLTAVYTVKRGDTLWELCDRYFHNPWDWPRIWSYNPELQNPHWIYPGDQIRMQSATEVAKAGPAGPSRQLGNGIRFIGRANKVKPNTVFLRDQGYIDDEVKDVWGEVNGSPDDQLLLSDGDNAYLEIKAGHDVRVGQDLTVFRPVQGEMRGDVKGTLVAILGTARVEKWDPESRIARAKLIESLDVIGRGSMIGPMTRRFEIIPPVPNTAEVQGHIAASVYPHVLYGQNQVVFVDRGAQEGLAPGNRLFVVTRGDGYRKTLVGASQFASAEVHYDSERPATIEKGGALGKGDQSKFPEEVTAELRVLSVRDHSAACLVINSLFEIEPGQTVVARRGF